jgi:two-component system, chemotaxis family, protein-glutamate methylesterase/glutaminase
MIPEQRTRILIVDDSAVMRSLLRAVVCSDNAFEVAGTAADGASALQAIEALHPNLVLLDVEMPVMDGLATLRELRKRGHPVPVIMCSSLTQRGARVTIEALASGASDYVAKPAGQADRESGIRALAHDLIPKVKALTRRTLHEPLESNCARSPGTRPSVTALRAAAVAAGPGPLGDFAPRVVAIGVSTGGPAALERVLPAFPRSFPLPVLVVQHMPELFTALLAERLNGRCRLNVREAAEGDAVRPGTIFVARGNWHMEVLAAACASAMPTLHLTQTLPENHCRPSVDVLFRSAAAAYGGGVLAAVLTGMGSDGLAGCRLLRSMGSAVLAQDQGTSAVWGMPGAVITAGLANRVLPLDAIAAEIIRLEAESRGATHTLPNAAQETMP